MIYAIGDIHGKRAILRQALTYLRDTMTAGDTAIFLGDYIDRGEDSRGVLEDLMAFKIEFSSTIILLGNHEDLLFRAINGYQRGDKIHLSDAEYIWLVNGGVETIKSYDVEDPERWPYYIPDAHLDFLEVAEMEWKQDGYHFVHAGVIPTGKSWDGEGRDLDSRLWIRDEFIESDEDFGDIVVFGHTPMEGGLPLIEKNKIGIDTGCGKGGVLTLVTLEARTEGEPAKIGKIVQFDDKLDGPDDTLTNILVGQASE